MVGALRKVGEDVGAVGTGGHLQWRWLEAKPTETVLVSESIEPASGVLGDGTNLVAPQQDFDPGNVLECFRRHWCSVSGVRVGEPGLRPIGGG